MHQLHGRSTCKRWASTSDGPSEPHRSLCSAYFYRQILGWRCIRPSGRYESGVLFPRQERLEQAYFRDMGMGTRGRRRNQGHHNASRKAQCLGELSCTRPTSRPQLAEVRCLPVCHLSRSKHRCSGILTERNGMPEQVTISDPRRRSIGSIQQAYAPRGIGASDVFLARENHQLPYHRQQATGNRQQATERNQSIGR